MLTRGCENGNTNIVWILSRKSKNGSIPVGKRIFLACMSFAVKNIMPWRVLLDMKHFSLSRIGDISDMSTGRMNIIARLLQLRFSCFGTVQRMRPSFFLLVILTRLDSMKQEKVKQIFSVLALHKHSKLNIIKSSTKREKVIVIKSPKKLIK